MRAWRMKICLASLIAVAIAMVFSCGDTQAYYKKQKNGKYCFAIQYEQPGLNYSGGATDNAGLTNYINGQVYSTGRVCASLKDKKVDGKLTYLNKPKDTVAMSHPSLEVRNGDTVVLYTCSSGSNVCLRPKTTTFKVSSYATFGELAKAVYAATPAQYDNNRNTKKLALKGSGKTTADVQKESQKTNGEDDQPGEVEQNCANAGGAQSLGWIVCPILTWAGEGAEYLYNTLVEPGLQIQPKLFTGKGSDVEKAWSTFRDIANIVFVILLLVVIFSQLTGVGIDNYGIKKILPKLIIAAVLINLSYLLCVIAVDISNIAGNGFQALFDGFAGGFGDGTAEIRVKGESGTKDVILTVGKRGLASVAVLGATVMGVGAALWGNAAIVLSLLVSALGVVISLFFLFILLAAREAAVVVLTVVSPIAVVCYMLPNTRKIFDKWLKGMEGLLLVYPICGLLVGGGNYVSKLLLFSGFSDHGFTSALTAMVAGIVPVFFIPTVLRNSFNALGNLGARISGIGRTVSGGVTRRARESGAYQNIQEAGRMREARIKGGLDRDGNPVTGWRRRLSSIAAGGRSSRLRYANKYDRMLNEQGALAAAEGEDFALRTQTANVMRQLQATGDINNIASLNSGLQQALLSGNRAEIRAYTDALSAKGDDGRKNVKEAWNAAVSTGNVSGIAASTFADNILENHAADYKNNHRSVFAVAQSINSSSPENRREKIQTTGEYLDNPTGDAVSGRAELASKITANTIAGMDDNAFEEVFHDGTIPSGVSEDKAEMIAAAAYAALSDQNANIKVDRRAALNNILKNTNYVPSSQRVEVVNGGELQLNHTQASAPTGGNQAGSSTGIITDPGVAEAEFRRGRQDGDFKLGQ